MNRLSMEQLKEVAVDCEALVPDYYIGQLHPMEALETGVGNCFSKAMIASGIIVVRYNVEPSVVYSERLHGAERGSGKPIDPKSKKNMAHIVVAVPSEVPEVVSEDANPNPVWSLDYGINVGVGNTIFKNDPADFMDYNEMDDWVLEDPRGIIVPTEEGAEMGLTAGLWRIKGQEYLKKIDRASFDYNELLDLITLKLVELEEVRGQEEVLIGEEPTEKSTRRSA